MQEEGYPSPRSCRIASDVQERSVHDPVKIPVDMVRPRVVEKTVEVPKMHTQEKGMRTVVDTTEQGQAQGRSVHHPVEILVEVLHPHAAEKTIEVPKMHIQERSMLKKPEGMR